MSFVLLALGLVLAVEGLVIALAPKRLEDIVILLARIPVEQRRMIGLGALALGVVLVWLARGLGATM